MTPMSEMGAPAPRRGKTPPPREPLDLNKIVNACVDEGGGRNLDAANCLQELAEGDDELFRLIMQDGLRLRCYELTKACIASRNRAIRNDQDRPRPATPAVTASAAGNDRRAAQVGAASKRRGEFESRKLSDMSIWGMGRLADITFAQVTIAKDKYREQKETYALSERFMAGIEPLGRADQIVGRICNEARLIRLYVQAKEAA